MKAPEDIAKLLSEDIYRNNGFISEADDPRLANFQYPKGSGGIIITKRGTVIEANAIVDDGGPVVWAAVGESKPRRSMGCRHKATLYRKHPDSGLYKLRGWTYTLGHYKHPEEHPAYTIDQIREMLTRYEAFLAESNAAHEKFLATVTTDLADPNLTNDEYMAPGRTWAAIEAKIIAKYGLEEFAKHSFRTTGWLMVDRPFGKILSIKRENIHRIDR